MPTREEKKNKQCLTSFFCGIYMQLPVDQGNSKDDLEIERLAWKQITKKMKFDLTIFVHILLNLKISEKQPTHVFSNHQNFYEF